MEPKNSLERTLAILELFTEERLEWTPEAMMAALGYSRPTLYRYLRTLRAAGLLTSLPGAAFTLGPKVVEMDYLMRKSDALVRNGQPLLERLAAQFPCTALLVRWYGNRILCVASECSTADPVSSYPRGRPMPLVRGAIARSILAFLPRRQRVAMVESNLAEFRAVGLGGSRDEVLERLRAVRKAGHAVARGEVTPGVVGLAAPVLDAARVPIASLCVTLAAERASADTVAEIARELRAASGALSAGLIERRAGTHAPARDGTRARAPEPAPRRNRQFAKEST